jgi:ATP-binding cassette subfamily F protein 3
MRSEIVTRRSKSLKSLERAIAQTEDDIETNENTLSDLNHAILVASQAQDGQRIAELSRQIHTCQSAIDDLFDKLERFTTEFDTKNAIFEKQLEDLGRDHDG